MTLFLVWLKLDLSTVLLAALVHTRLKREKISLEFFSLIFLYFGKKLLNYDS